MYGLRVITPATQEPVSLAELRAQTNVTHTLQDPELAAFIMAARQWVEMITGRALAVQTFEITLDEFPGWEIALPRSPVASISSITYLDSAGAQQTLPGADYVLEATRLVPTLTPAYGKTWPTSRGTAGNVKVQFVAGEAQPPQPLRLAVLLLAAQWNEHREAPPENPAVDALISPYRLSIF